MADLTEAERVIAATRRPDGTLRKERKVRPGFVPQEEQEVYVSRGAKFRDAAKNHVPGMNPEALRAAQAANLAAKSKAARKNEKRKEKRQAEKITAATDTQAAASAQPAGNLADPTASMHQLSLNENRDASAHQAAADDAAEGATHSAAVDRQIRAVRKKLRQCEVLQREKDRGEQLTAEEQRKLDKVPEWTAELEALVGKS